MRRWIWVGIIATLTGGVLCPIASAKYRSDAGTKARGTPREETFERSVDLQRFRKGNFEWDTQELIASGMTALHREQLQILQELEEIKARLARLESEK